MPFSPPSCVCFRWPLTSQQILVTAPSPRCLCLNHSSDSLYEFSCWVQATVRVTNIQKQWDSTELSDIIKCVWLCKIRSHFPPQRGSEFTVCVCNVQSRLKFLKEPSQNKISLSSLLEDHKQINLPLQISISLSSQRAPPDTRRPPSHLITPAEQ